MKTFTIRCPHMDCARSYVIPQLTKEQKGRVAELYRKLLKTSRQGKRSNKISGRQWSEHVQTLDRTLKDTIAEYVGPEIRHDLPTHISALKDVCFHCEGPIQGDDLVYCPRCRVPNLNW